MKTFDDITDSPMGWVRDSVDHINMWEHATTRLGKCLAHNHRKPFYHNYFGKFDSVEAFWYYMQSVSKDDRIRVLSGMNLKVFCKKIDMARVINFRAIIMDTNWQCINQHPDIKQMMINSTLPFDSYYVNKASGIRIRPVFYKWLLPGFEEIRSALQESRQPVWTELLDYSDSSIYQYVLPKPVELLTHQQAIQLIDLLQASS